jgi:hypothetical protein
VTRTFSFGRLFRLFRAMMLSSLLKTTHHSSLAAA